MRNFQLNKKALRLSIWILLLSFAILSVTSWLVYENVKKDQTAYLEAEVENSKYKLANYLQKNFQLADMMAGYIASNPQISSEAFDAYAKRLLDNFNP